MQYAAWNLGEGEGEGGGEGGGEGEGEGVGRGEEEGGRGERRGGWCGLQGGVLQRMSAGGLAHLSASRLID